MQEKTDKGGGERLLVEKEGSDEVDLLKGKCIDGAIYGR